MIVTPSPFTLDQIEEFRQGDTAARSDGTTIGDLFHRLMAQINEAAQSALKNTWPKSQAALVINSDRLQQLDEKTLHLLTCIFQMENFIRNAEISPTQRATLERLGIPRSYTRQEVQRVFSLAYYLFRDDDQIQPQHQQSCSEGRIVCGEALQALGLRLLPWKELVRHRPRSVAEFTRS